MPAYRRFLRFIPYPLAVILSETTVEVNLTDVAQIVTCFMNATHNYPFTIKIY